MAQSNLAALNSATLGAQMPEVTLPDGSKIQTGTLGALIINIKTYDGLVASADQAKIMGVEDKFKAAMPILKKSGLMDVFSPEDWIAGSSPGRKRVGELYREFVNSA